MDLGPWSLRNNRNEAKIYPRIETRINRQFTSVGMFVEGWRKQENPEKTNTDTEEHVEFQSRCELGEMCIYAYWNGIPHICTQK